MFQGSGLPVFPAGPFTIGTSCLPAIPLDQLPLPRCTSSTELWPLYPLPLPSIRAASESSIRPTLGSPSENECSPSLPPLSYPTQTYRSVSLADLVDEEGSHPGTRGGMRPSPLPAAAHVNTSLSKYYPPLSICIVDVTPLLTRNPVLEAPEVSEVKSLRSSPSSPPGTPDRFCGQVPAPSRIPLTFPVSNDRRCAASEGRKARRSTRKGTSLADSETPKRPITRSSAKRKAADNPGMDGEHPKRAKTDSP